MAAPKFVLGTNELQFTRGLRYPLSRPMQKIQVVDRTAAGTLQIEDFGQSISRRTLPFRNLPLSDYSGLTNWFDNIANGSANEFTYYDENGQSMQVRIVTNPLDFPQTSYQRYSGDLELEVVG